MFIRTSEVDRKAQISRCNYDTSNIFKLIKSQFHIVFSNKIINLRMHYYQYRVKRNLNIILAIACYTKHFILEQLGFGSQSTVIETLQKQAVEYMEFSAICVFKQHCCSQFKDYQICMHTQILLNYFHLVIVK